ncbi:CoA-disulfide reductase [Rhodococcus sp. ACPA4]|uniref:FAD-dependent oxidoreductase n=1 Tax=Rhodococcus sp. ACPA4 TaxID=2028571 RepID=UPI000BB0EE06|nr:FAD-dependent oxidoreductase [Rhodococcus sp. ACPA4]PBC35851.1 CoA-disulfide reductase [Rhodococcus sp. ACPA4]
MTTQERPERIVVIGADAAGMSAAHQALRSAKGNSRAVEVIALEKTRDTSYSACGIPYLVSGIVDSEDSLSARTPERHREMGVDLRLDANVVSISLEARTVTYVDTAGAAETIGFDKLVLATGAHPVIPSWATGNDGQLVTGIHPVKNLDDARQWLDLVLPEPSADPESSPKERHAIVVGAGYIGVEMAEAMFDRGFATTLITRSAVMSNLDSDMSERVMNSIVEGGVQVLSDCTVKSVEVVDGRVRSLTASNGETYPADVVVLGLGVRPATELGADAGIPVGDFGGYLPDENQSVAENVWAAGDCCEVIDRLTGNRIFAPLGTHANKQGRICGYNVVGGKQQFAGVLATAITRFTNAKVHVEVGRTGMSTDAAIKAGFNPESLVTVGGTASGYMRERSTIATKVIADRHSRRLLGVQIVGGHNSAKRIDTAAAALWGEMTVDDLATMDLSYSPPFATVWEAIQLAARRLADRI